MLLRIALFTMDCTSGHQERGFCSGGKHGILKNVHLQYLYALTNDQSLLAEKFMPTCRKPRVLFTAKLPLHNIISISATRRSVFVIKHLRKARKGWRTPQQS